MDRDGQDGSNTDLLTQGVCSCDFDESIGQQSSFKNVLLWANIIFAFSS